MTEKRQQIQAIRGMPDVLPGEVEYYQFLEATARAVFARHGYREIRVPVIEPTELFARTVGDSSDIVVSKQMYTFTDPGERSNTLRPEGTAGVVRALVEHGTLKETAQQKLWYSGPMFRYEKPQKGRLRQFNQIGVEAFGIAHPAADAETIVICHDFLRAAGFGRVTVRLNNLGDPPERRAYNERLRDLVAGAGPAAGWCAQCVERARVNPMRVFDCKEERCREMVRDLPRVADFAGPDARAHFATVCRLLDDCGVAWEIDPLLVRGLDYYCRTVYEVVQEGTGAQSSVAGGGRYDGLVAELGGPATPAVGFSCGVERLIIAMRAQGIAPPDPAPPSFYLLALDEPSLPAVFRLAEAARRAGRTVAFDLQPRGAKAGMKAANKTGAAAAVIIGADELARGAAQWKDLATGDQTELPIAEVETRLTR